MLNDFGQYQVLIFPMLVAVLILILGWIISKLIASGLNKFMKKNKFINEKLTTKLGEKNSLMTADFISKAVYYILMIFVLVAAFQVLGLSIITQPLNGLLSVTFAYLPQLLGAVILLLAAWVIATLLKHAILIFFSRTRMDERVEGHLEPGVQRTKLSVTLADLMYWFVFILFLPAILSALSLNGLLIPIQNMVNTFLGIIPDLFAAAIVLVVGWFIATLCRNIATNFLRALKVDDFGKRSGLTVDEGTRSLADILGTVIYIMILIPVAISALNVLNLESIAQPATDMLTRIFVFLPVLFSALFIVAFAYFIGKMIGELTTSLLRKIGFDRVLPVIGIRGATFSLSLWAGKIVTLLIVLVAALEAADLLGFARLSGMMEEFVLLAGNILMGVVIIGIGMYVANLQAEMVRQSDIKNAHTIALIGKAAILVLAVTMGLSQMGLAPDIITLAFTFLGGSLAVSFAIAFGLGGRDLASRKLEEMDSKMKKEENVPPDFRP